jgi:hypothetical protein
VWDSGAQAYFTECVYLYNRYCSTYYKAVRVGGVTSRTECVVTAVPVVPVVFITAVPITKLCVYMVCVCLLLQYLIQSCARGGRRIVEDMCYEIRRAEACVD